MADWNSQQYLKYENERTQPAKDLLNRINTNKPKRILDVGCGPGNSTKILAERYPEAYVLGIDSSEHMVTKAKQINPTINFQTFDASGDLSPLGNDFDIVFSNACIQWISNHDKLLPNLIQLLIPGGLLAVQMPISDKEPFRQIIKEVSQQPRWHLDFSSLGEENALSSEEYYDLLSANSSAFSIWQTTYFHTMHSHQDIIEWSKGTRLRPYLEALPTDLQPLFEETIYEQVKASYPVQQNNHIIFKFPRLFFTAIAK